MANKPAGKPRRVNGRVGHDSAYQPWDHLSDDEREVYRRRSVASAKAKSDAVNGVGPEPLHAVNRPLLDPDALMPLLPNHGMRTLSLFSGGGGLDLGFERAGFAHVASYEIIDDAAQTIRQARPAWVVNGGDSGDVRRVDWRAFRGGVDVIHGGPPCQPFSSAGRQRGAADDRDMWPEYIRALLEIRPLAFVAENVPALMQSKFSDYVDEVILQPLQDHYHVQRFLLHAAGFGVPQLRRRVFLVGFRSKERAKRFVPPEPTHTAERFVKERHEQVSLQLGGHGPALNDTLGVREALGLPSIGYDYLAPTIRCSWTGPRGTTSILSSVSAKHAWHRLQIWPNGVAPDREAARRFVARNGHFRLSVPDCALLQGFPDTWPFYGSVYMALGQVGNAVPPPLAYHVAASVARAM